MKISEAKNAMLQSVPKESNCAEIGVWKGKFSKLILKIVKPETLYLIDPWVFLPTYEKRMYGGKTAKKQKDMDKIYNTVVDKFKFHKNIKIIRDYSKKVCKLIGNESLSFVYIDGNHSYQFVKKDIEMYFSKVKNGGIIAGDDILWGIGEGLPVLRALIGFLIKRHNECRLLSLKGGQFVIKKESKNIRRWIKNLLKNLKVLGNITALIILFFLVYTLLDNYSLYLSYLKNLKQEYLVLSILLLIVGQAIKSLFSLISIRLVRKNITIIEAYRIWFLCHAAKYIPGAIWPYLSRAYVYSSNGLKPFDSGILVGFETSALIIANFILCVPIVWLHYRNATILFIFFVAIMISALFFGYKLKKFSLFIRGKLIGCYILIALLSSVIITFGFYMLISSMWDVYIPIFPGLFVFPMAWVAGLLVFFAPMGIGPRELVLSLFLANYLNGTEMFFFLALSRLWWSIGDAIIISIALLMQIVKNFKK